MCKTRIPFVSCSGKTASRQRVHLDHFELLREVLLLRLQQQTAARARKQQFEVHIIAHDAAVLPVYDETQLAHVFFHANHSLRLQHAAAALRSVTGALERARTALGTHLKKRDEVVVYQEHDHPLAQTRHARSCSRHTPPVT
jgi:hypothetical protein